MCSPPYRVSQRQWRVDPITKADEDYGLGGKKLDNEGTSRGESQGCWACGSSMMTVVPLPGVLSKYIVPW